MVSLTDKKFPLMVVEDSDEDFEALSRILCTLGIKIRVQRCGTGDECLKALGHGTEDNPDADKRLLPGLILLDLNLPGTDGRDALRMIKTDPYLKMIPVTVLTSSASPGDVAACYAYGVNAYVLKSLDFDDLTKTVRTVTDFWFRTAVLPTANFLEQTSAERAG
ncbi:MAG: response regulator [Janthinobacterium lividum]